MKKYIRALMVGLFVLLFVPIVVTQLTKPKSRSFDFVRLDNTDYQEIHFQNTTQDLELAGMLFVPEGDGPFPAAVIIHGSGASSRNNGWYLTLTQSLQENGVVVLLPDKRGSEQSEGDWRTASFVDLATDTLAAVSFLKSQDEVAISNIGIVGMSQGGHFAPLVATESLDVTFLVNVVGGSLPMHDQLVYEETHNLREIGFLPGLSDSLAYPSSWMIISVRQKVFWDSIGNFDAVPYWQRLSIESLVLYGELDTNVPSSESAEILRSFGKPNIDVRIYKGSGHALESPTGEGNSIFREDALRDIRDFVLSTTASL